MGNDRYPIIKLWTPEDERQLREMIGRGCRPNEVAAALDRTQKAIRNRANLLGLMFGRIRNDAPRSRFER
ncbi:hypothetical protein [Bradyrhizobium sp. URHA0013]|uniref:hypothetical protein n=1 Tax=Bradyrhizobium sp. URHA0013 TaxID=1380352 RepID=UPI0004B4014F|nr:hypothetical protein [Bradyrhizobium sp. URHA0013]